MKRNITVLVSASFLLVAACGVHETTSGTTGAGGGGDTTTTTTGTSGMMATTATGTGGMTTTTATGTGGTTVSSTTGTGGPPCSGSTDCDDNNPCTADACEASVCVHTPVSDGTACDDGDACTKLDACQSGVCTGKNPVVCPAPDACHDPGTCDSATGVCSDPVKPGAAKTCAGLGFNCGMADDGCGGTLDCGTCTGTDTCAGGGQANVCGTANCQTGKTQACGHCNTGHATCMGPAPGYWGVCTGMTGCAPSATQSCTPSFPYGCTGSETCDPSSCAWGACVKSCVPFTPDTNMPGVFAGAFLNYNSGPNCNGSYNDYGPMQVCPSGSHIATLDCQLVPGSNGNCAGLQATPTTTLLRVLANNNCTQGAQAHLVVTCIAD